MSNDHLAALFPDNELNDLRARWDKTQISSCRRTLAPQSNKPTVSSPLVVKRLAEQFAAERA